MFIKEILADLPGAAKPIIRKYEQKEGSNILAIGLNQNVILKEHKSDIPARILVIKGAINYVTKEKRVEIALFEEHVIPVGEYHSVEPQEDSIFLVIKK